jgi:cytochrome d ubiquinol oxidase subunit II
MLTTHGAVYVVMKTTDALAERARRIGIVTALVTAALFALAGVWVFVALDGHTITSPIDHGAPSNPLHKTVEVAASAWFGNYRAQPLTALAPLLGLLGPLLAAWLLWRRRALGSFLASALGLAGIIATPGLAMFPFILPSSSVPNHGLTVWDASSSQMTLFVMLIAVAIFLPIVLAYTAWVYRVLHGKVTPKLFETNRQAY